MFGFHGRQRAASVFHPVASHVLWARENSTVNSWENVTEKSKSSLSPVEGSSDLMLPQGRAAAPGTWSTPEHCCSRVTPVSCVRKLHSADQAASWLRSGQTPHVHCLCPSALPWPPSHRSSEACPHTQRFAPERSISCWRRHDFLPSWGMTFLSAQTQSLLVKTDRVFSGGTEINGKQNSRCRGQNFPLYNSID